MLDILVGFVAELRQLGLPVSVSEEVDAAEAMAQLPLEDRQAIKSALGATLVKSANHWRAFDTAFEVYFSIRGAQFLLDGEATPLGEQDGRAEPAPDGQHPEGFGGTETATAEEIAAMVIRALRDGDQLLLSAIARLAVARYAAMEPGRPVGGLITFTGRFVISTWRARSPGSSPRRVLVRAASWTTNTPAERSCGGDGPASSPPSRSACWKMSTTPASSS